METAKGSAEVATSSAEVVTGSAEMAAGSAVMATREAEVVAGLAEVAAEVGARESEWELKCEPDVEMRAVVETQAEFGTRAVV